MKAPPRAAGGGSVTGAEPPPLDRRPLAAVLLETDARDHSRLLVLQLQGSADSGHVHDVGSPMQGGQESPVVKEMSVLTSSMRP